MTKRSILFSVIFGGFLLLTFVGCGGSSNSDSRKDSASDVTQCDTNDAEETTEIKTPINDTVATESEMTTDIPDGPSLKVPGDVASIEEAYERIPSGGVIILSPGVYRIAQPIVIRKDVTIIGDEKKPQSVVLAGMQSDVLQLESGFAQIRGLTIKNEGIPGANPNLQQAVLVTSPKSMFRNCIFTSRIGIGLNIRHNMVSSDVTNCTAQGCGEFGFCVNSGAAGTFRKCATKGCKYGMVINNAGTNPTVEGCVFTNGINGGIMIKDGSGIFRNCTISGCKAGFVVVGAGSNPVVEKCKITDCQSGVAVMSAGVGTFRNCTFSDNKYVGISAMEAESNLIVEDCSITDTQGIGIVVNESASGTFRNNELSGNGNADWEVSEGVNIVRVGNTPNE